MVKHTRRNNKKSRRNIKKSRKMRGGDRKYYTPHTLFSEDNKKQLKDWRFEDGDIPKLQHAKNRLELDNDAFMTTIRIFIVNHWEPSKIIDQIEEAADETDSEETDDEQEGGKKKRSKKSRKSKRKSRKQKGGICYGSGVGANNYDPNFSIYNTRELQLFPYKPN